MLRENTVSLLITVSGRCVLNNRKLVICDRDNAYCTALSEYIRRTDCGYEVVLYTEPERFCRECSGKDISLLLIQEEFQTDADNILSSSDLVAGIKAERQFVLTENREAASGTDSIYKYQSAAHIVGIIGEDIEAAHRIVNEAKRCPGMKLIGVYSPVGHTLKTTFAMTMGQILAENQQVLYINLEGYNGLTDVLDIRSEYTLTDLIYNYSIYPDELGGMLAQYTVRFNELSVLLPARSPFELQEIEPSMWLSLISTLSGMGRFDAVILDISDAVRGIIDLLNVCTEVYMPVRKDRMAVAKLKDFDIFLSRFPNTESLTGKLKRLKFPYFDDIDTVQLNYKNSRLGRYIRQEIIMGQ